MNYIDIPNLEDPCLNVRRYISRYSNVIIPEIKKGVLLIQKYFPNHALFLNVFHREKRRAQLYIIIKAVNDDTLKVINIFRKLSDEWVNNMEPSMIDFTVIWDENINIFKSYYEKKIK